MLLTLWSVALKSRDKTDKVRTRKGEGFINSKRGESLMRDYFNKVAILTASVAVSLTAIYAIV